MPQTARTADREVGATNRDDEAEAERGAREVVSRLRAAGFEALWAGGCVRDRALGLRPKDYDVASDASPDDVARVFERVVLVGAQFGVCRVLLGGAEYEVARFRADGPREDALRRDFTINGLLYDPHEERLIDHVGGVADLSAGLIRACGGDPRARFDEDPLRILRAARFAARFGFGIEDGTWAAMVAGAHRVLEASGERIRDELERALTQGAVGELGEVRVGGAADPRAASGPARAFAVLADLGLDVLLLPELGPLDGARARLGFLGPTRPEVGWAALAYDLDAPERAFADLAARLRMPTRLGRDVGRAIAIARAMPGYRELDLAARKRLVRDPMASAAATVARLVSASGQAPDAGRAAAERDRARWTREDLEPPALLSGRDLAAAGHRPGPLFKRILDAVEDAWLEGRVRDRADALALADALARAEG